VDALIFNVRPTAPTAWTHRQIDLHILHILDGGLRVFAGANSPINHAIWKSGVLQLFSQVEGWLLNGSIIHFEIMAQLGNAHTWLMVHT
jgi:hypothetical protein